MLVNSLLRRNSSGSSRNLPLPGGGGTLPAQKARCSKARLAKSAMSQMCVLIYVLVSDLPAYGCVQTPLLVSYLVRNRTLQVQEVEVTVEPSDAFMYSGHKQVRSSCLSDL